MAKCGHCSAPLPPNSQYCRYCGVRNDIDLRAIQSSDVGASASDRPCPHCRIPLKTIRLDLDPPLQIERCDSCFGLFFDPGEVESLLNCAVSPVFDANPRLIGNINQDRYRKEQKVKYLKCPVCGVLMNRVAFGLRSGVIVDRCLSHGVWLDGGEITHLLEWKKAGGQLLHDKKRAEQQAKNARLRNAPGAGIGSSSTFQRQTGDDIELLTSVAGVIFSLFE